MSIDQKKVAIIGGGPAGLCCAKRLLLDGFTIVIFEQQDEIGGIWYGDPSSNDTTPPVDYRLLVEAGRHTQSRPLYDDLCTNLPRPAMLFPDFPTDYPTNYPTARQVLDYLRHYALDAGLLPFLRLAHVVEAVDALSETDEFTQWRVAVHHLPSGLRDTIVVDHVVVANGHYSRPKLPAIDGLFDHFRGLLLHSGAYRNPSIFREKSVLVIGAGFSGVDIASAVARVARRCWLSSRSSGPEQGQDGEPIAVRQLVVVTPEALHFEDGLVLPHPDVIIMATGFCYDYPMLGRALIDVSDNYVSPLYKQLLHVRHPSLAFPGIPFRIIPFLLLHHQAIWLSKVWSGSLSLPPLPFRLKTLSTFEQESKARPLHHYHRLGDDQFQYIAELCQESGATPPIDLEKIWFHRRF